MTTAQPASTPPSPETDPVARRRAKVERWRRRDAAASRASAYVYGNILALAAVGVVDPHRAPDLHGVFVVLGTGVATFVAHVFSELVGHRVRHGEGATWAETLHEASLSRSILVSAALPAAALALAVPGWLPPQAAFWIAAGIVTVRLALLGYVLARVGGRGRTLGTLLTGFAFAAVCAVVAVLKLLLGH